MTRLILQSESTSPAHYCLALIVTIATLYPRVEEAMRRVWAKRQRGADPADPEPTFNEVSLRLLRSDMRWEGWDE